MNRREALNVAWHARVNGLAALTPEHILGAFAVLEGMDEERKLLCAKAAVCDAYRNWLADPTRANRKPLSEALALLRKLEALRESERPL